MTKTNVPEPHKTGLQLTRERNQRAREAALRKTTGLTYNDRIRLRSQVAGLPAERAERVINRAEALAAQHEPDPEPAEPKGDTTGTNRQQRRRAQLNELAQAAGWEGWSAYETAVLNGLVKLPKPAKRKK